MFDHVIHSQQMNLQYLKMLVKDIPDDKLCVQPKGCPSAMNHAAWVLGHLAATAAFTATLLGEKVADNPEWEKLYGPKSKPQADRKLYPSKNQLLKDVEDGYARVARAAKKMPAEKFKEPFPVEGMRQFMPTMGDGIIFLMTAHDAVHLGQLSAWRRAQGLPSVM